MKDEKLRKEDYEIKMVDHATAKALVEEHHYAKGGSNTGTHFFGLFKTGSDRCLGVAWFLPPTPPAAKATYEGEWRRVLSLTRLVIVPEVPTNGASFLLGHAIRALKEEEKWECIVTYADQGQDHEGTIYRASNWEYMGETGPYTNWITPEGQQVSAKRGPKNLTASEMRKQGCSKVRTKKHKFRYLLTENS